MFPKIKPNPQPVPEIAPEGLWSGFVKAAGPHLLTMALGGMLGAVGTWYSLNSQVQKNTVDITEIKANYVPASVHKAKDDGLRDQLEAINKNLEQMNLRLAAVEGVLMRK